MTERRFGVPRLKPWAMSAVAVCGFLIALGCALAGEWIPAIFFLIFGIFYASSAFFEKEKVGCPINGPNHRQEREGETQGSGSIH
jgi:hypothetical protein